MASADFRSELPVLVAQAESMGALAVIRSLGRARYPVHACATVPDALGFRSRFVRGHEVCPPYDSPELIPWLRGYVDRHEIRAVVPSEGLLLAIRPAFDELAPLLPIGGQLDARTVYAGMSKFDLFQTLLSSPDAGEHLPPTLLIPDTRALPDVEQLEALGAPLYVKVDGAYSREHENGFVQPAKDAQATLGALEELAPLFSRAVVQGHVGGRGVGAFFLLRDGQVLAEFMHRRLHEVPHTGGFSSLRESYFHEAIRHDALAKLRAAKWDGVAMMEYRHDPRSDRFWFLEMNGRFWGSLHLALAAGVDFPTMLLDTFFGRPPPARREFPLGVKCRLTFPADVHHLWSKLKDRNVAVGDKLASVAEFMWLGIDPRVHSDLCFPGDDLSMHGVRELLRATLQRARRA